MVFQSLAMSQALCVIGFDAYFLQNPTLCFFSSNCLPYYYSYGVYGLADSATLYNIKVPLIIGQLTAGVLMFVSCVIYIVIFGVTVCRVSNSIHFQGGSVAQGIVAPAPSGYIPPPPPMNYNYGPPPMGYPVRPPPANSPAHRSKNQLICPNCRSTYLVGE